MTWDDGFTAVFGPDPQPCRSEASRHVIGHRSQQGLCCECFFQLSDRGTSNPGDSRARDVALCHDADHGMKRSHQLLSVSWKEAPFHVLWAEARRSCC